MSSQVFSGLGYTFRVDADEPIHGVLATALAPLAADPPHDGSVEQITVRNSAGTWTVATATIELHATTVATALARTLEHINQRAAASVAPNVPLHAAAIRHETGPVVALAGVSGSGKSTLAAAAVLRGWGFVADEVSAVADEQDHQPKVQEYHRPIGLRAGGAAAIGVDIPWASDGRFDDVYPWPIEAARRVTGGPLVAIALVERHHGARPQSAALSPAAALAALVEHVVVPDDDDVVPVFRSLDRLVRKLPVARLSFDTPDEGLALLDELVSPR